jgi:gas vesicle protein
MSDREDTYGVDHMVRDLFLIAGGILVGAAVALLYAPETGERTRRRIQRAYEDVKDQAFDLRDEMADRVEDLRRSVVRQIEAGKDLVGDTKSQFLAGLSDLERSLSALGKRLSRE